MTVKAETPHLSGFAKKKVLEELGFTVTKHQTLLGQLLGTADAKWFCVLDKKVVSQDRLQGVAVNKAIEALGGL